MIAYYAMPQIQLFVQNLLPHVFLSKIGVLWLYFLLLSANVTNSHAHADQIALWLTRISGPYGPKILAPAVGLVLLASLAKGERTIGRTNMINGII